MLKPVRQTVHPYDNVIISCEVTGDEPITIEWHAENREMPRSVHISGHILQFPQIQVSDAGRYRCTAKNNYGQAEAAAEVLVQGWMVCSNRNGNLNEIVFICRERV